MSLFERAWPLGVWAYQEIVLMAAEGAGFLMSSLSESQRIRSAKKISILEVKKAPNLLKSPP
jgi:hypothetical protein